MSDYKKPTDAEKRFAWETITRLLDIEKMSNTERIAYQLLDRSINPPEKRKQPDEPITLFQ